jgi:hypothetical protein
VRPYQALSVDESAVGGPQIFDYIAAGLQGQPCVLAGYFRIVDDDPVADIPADRDIFLHQLKDLPRVGAFMHHQLIHL